MTLSPASTASSDLYATSEPSHKDNPNIQASEEDRPLARRAPITIQGEASAHPGASWLYRENEKPMQNGLALSWHHKRKREPELPLGALSHNESTGLDSTAPSVASEESLVQFGTANPIVKRSKTMDYATEPQSSAKVSSKPSLLSASMWQHVFCYVPPVSLGRLLRVNHAFGNYLTVSDTRLDLPRIPNSIAQPLSAEAIWIASRRLFCPGLPRPLKGKTELEMWRLLLGRNCQVCGVIKTLNTSSDSGNPWESGPGPDHVKVVWPFGLRCCGPCLQNVSKREIELTISGELPFFLLQGLPVAFVTEGNHFVGQNLLRNSTIPPGLRVSKQYYVPHLSDIGQQFSNAKELGPASAEEWTKGLAQEGQERLDDTLRWEQWEAKGGLKKINSRHVPKSMMHGPTILENKAMTFKREPVLDRTNSQRVASPTTVEPSFGTPVPQIETSQPAQLPQGHYSPARNGPSLYSSSSHYGQQFSFHPARPERNLRDVIEAKVARRIEIERRCLGLDPPLHPNLLNHMDSFQAAIQISQPLTDSAWEVLRPRLLAQRPHAERRERERAQELESKEEESRQRRQQEAQLKETKENQDREWDSLQAPIRTRLGVLADEIVATKWSNGKKVTKENCPKFAANVLLIVRERFYAEVAYHEKATLVAGNPSGRGSPKEYPTLVLENMKWVFDNKIKPLTDHFQRELFLCNGCEGNFKFYGFEGVIQHYAAKHTTALSMGTQTVHWRAEWPQESPFHPDPSAAKSAYYNVPTPAPLFTGHANPGRDPHTVLPDRGAGQGALPFHPSSHDHNDGKIATDLSSATLNFHSGLTRSQVEKTSSPFSVPGQDFVPLHPGPQSGYTSGAGAFSPYAATQPVQRQQNYVSGVNQYQYPHNQGQPNPGSQPFVPGPGVGIQQSRPPIQFPPPSHVNGAPINPPPRFDFNRTNNTGPVSDLYQRQMDEMAKHAKEVFTSLGGIKDLPGSVRMFVTIQHTVSRFQAAFPNEPSLAMFIDGLDRSPTMRPVRSVNGLACLTCVRNGTNANIGNQTQASLVGDRRLYTLPQLVNHFKNTHVENPQSTGIPQQGLSTPVYDWKHDMVELPPTPVISNLINLAGMNDSKLALIAMVFPSAFPSPLPKLRGSGSTGPIPVYRGDINEPAAKQETTLSTDMSEPMTYPSDQPNSQNLERPYSGFRPLSQAALPEPAGEDEYDPARPAFLGRIVKIDSQTHKPSRPFGPQANQPSSSAVPNESSQPNADRRSYDRAMQSAVGPSFNSNHDQIPRNYGQGYPAKSAPLTNTSAQTMYEVNSRVDGYQTNHERREDLNEAERLAKPGTRYRATPEHARRVDNLKVSSTHGAYTTPLPQGLDDADRFLSSIAQGPRGATSLKAATSSRTTNGGQELDIPEIAESMHQPVLFVDDRAYEAWPRARSRGGREEHVRSNTQLLIDRPETRTGNGFILRPESEYERRPDGFSHYGSGSHTQIPLTPGRDNVYPTAAYDTYGDSHRTTLQEGGSRGGSRSRQVTRVSQYRDRSRSPEPTAAETGLYRTRSPVEEDRRDSNYQARSSSLRKENRPERFVRYQYEQQPRYEYVDTAVEPQYSRRVEYVPVRYKDASPNEGPRYVIRHAVEPPVTPQYVRYEQGYAPEPVYERNGNSNGQVYQTSDRAYQEQSSQVVPSFAEDHRY